MRLNSLTPKALAAAALCVLAAPSAWAAYPDKPIRIVVTFPPGGAPDILARLFADKAQLGQNIVIDNKAGAGGNIGADFVAKAPADGYTILLTTNSTIVINPNLVKLPYDPVRDFAPVSQVATLCFVLVAHPSLAIRSVPELIALARAKPGQLK